MTLLRESVAFGEELAASPVSASLSSSASSMVVAPELLAASKSRVLRRCCSYPDRLLFEARVDCFRLDVELDRVDEVLLRILGTVDTDLALLLEPVGAVTSFRFSSLRAPPVPASSSAAPFKGA